LLIIKHFNSILLLTASPTCRRPHVTK